MNYTVWYTNEGPENGRLITDASDHECAAENFAELDESEMAEYPMLNGVNRKVTVMDENKSTMEFSVSAEAIPTYYATKCSN